MSSMEISNAYSQLSLGTANTNTNSSSINNDHLTQQTMAGISAPIVSHRVVGGTNTSTINNSIQQDMALQRVQHSAAAGYPHSLSGAYSSATQAIFGLGNGANTGSELSLSGMEVCSPHKKVRFFADPLAVSNRSSMDEGLSSL